MLSSGMSPLHAPPSAFPAPAAASGSGGPSRDDPLADVLNLVRLSGALIFLVDASTPWCVDIPHTDAYRSVLTAPGQHVLSYHVVLEGSGIASVPGEAPVPFEAGDILVFPQGDGYRMESAPGTPPEFGPDEVIGFFRGLAAGEVPSIVPEGGGGEPKALFLCGFLACDARPFNPVLAKLKRRLVIRLPKDGNDSLTKLIEVAQAEIRSDQPGGRSIRLHLCELIFIETLRRYVLSLGASPEAGGPGDPDLAATGWLAALSDPVAGPAIAAIHAAPAEDWTLERLARRINTSRTVLAGRFTLTVGQSPMQYVTAWRLQLAAHRLRETRASIANIAWGVGYRSEAAFSRAFKKRTGVSPGAWRKGG